MRVNIKVKVSLPRDLEELSAGDSEATTDTLSGVQADCIAHHNAEGKGPLEVTDVDEVVPLDGQKSCEIDENQDLPTSDEKAATRQDAIFVEWAKDDPENPFNWPNKKKHLIAGVSIIMTLFVAAAATCYAWGASQIAEELQVSETVSLLGSSVFTLGFGVAPMALAPLSEVYGRSPVYLITYGLFALSFIPQALSPNITCLLISRFISGAMGSTGSTMVGGTLADIYHADTRGGPMSVFSSVTLYGTALGSITAAYVVVNGNMGWRWIFWLQLILNSLHFVLVSCILRETRGSVLLSRRAAKIRQETGDDRYVAATDAERSSLFVMIRLSLTRPFVFLFTEPAVIAYSVWVSFVWGVLCKAPDSHVGYRLTSSVLFLKAVPTLFQSVYGWSYGTSSLPFLGMIAGTTLALGLAPVQDMLYNNSARFHKGVPRSEARLYASMLGSSLFAIGMFVFGCKSR